MVIVMGQAKADCILSIETPFEHDSNPPFAGLSRLLNYLGEPLA